MAIPNIPTQAEMRARIPLKYGHYSNLARENLKKMSAAERLAKFGNDRIDRWNAEILEVEFLAKTPLEQEVEANWYIDWYQRMPSIPGPNGDYAKWGMMGYAIGVIRYDTCPCRLHVISETEGGDPTEWLETWHTGSEHNMGSGQFLYDAISNEQRRKNDSLGMLANLKSTDSETVKGSMAWEFDNNTRLVNGLSRFLTLSISDISVSERGTLQGLVDVRFGTNTILVVRA